MGYQRRLGHECRVGNQRQRRIQCRVGHQRAVWGTGTPVSEALTLALNGEN